MPALTPTISMMLMPLLAPALVAASYGKPLFNNATDQPPSKPFDLPKLNWTSDAHDTHSPQIQYTAKKGIVYQAGGESEASSFTSQSQVGWVYNWSPAFKSFSRDTEVEFVPMLWTTYALETQADKDNWNINTESNSAWSHVLGYNEPDQPFANGGSSVSASDAAAAWPDDMDYHGQYQSARAKFYLGAPAIAAADYTWMDTFISECSGCEFDFFPVHWYGDCNVDHFTQYLEAYKARYMGNGQPMWVTEFGFEGCSNSAEADEIVKAIEYLEAQDWIERYAYFGNLGTGAHDGEMCFLNDDTSWTCQGYAYINGNNPC